MRERIASVGTGKLTTTRKELQPVVAGGNVLLDRDSAGLRRCVREKSETWLTNNQNAVSLRRLAALLLTGLFELRQRAWWKVSDQRFDFAVPYDGLSRNLHRRNAEFLVDWICDKIGPGHRVAYR